MPFSRKKRRKRINANRKNAVYTVCSLYQTSQLPRSGKTAFLLRHTGNLSSWSHFVLQSGMSRSQPTSQIRAKKYHHKPKGVAHRAASVIFRTQNGFFHQSDFIDTSATAVKNHIPYRSRFLSCKYDGLLLRHDLEPRIQQSKQILDQLKSAITSVPEAKTEVDSDEYRQQQEIFFVYDTFDRLETARRAIASQILQERDLLVKAKKRFIQTRAHLHQGSITKIHSGDYSFFESFETKIPKKSWKKKSFYVETFMAGQPIIFWRSSKESVRSKVCGSGTSNSRSRPLFTPSTGGVPLQIECRYESLTAYWNIRFYWSHVGFFFSVGNLSKMITFGTMQSLRPYLTPAIFWWLPFSGQSIECFACRVPDHLRYPLDRRFFYHRVQRTQFKMVRLCSLFAICERFRRTGKTPSLPQQRNQQDSF